MVIPDPKGSNTDDVIVETAFGSPVSSVTPFSEVQLSEERMTGDPPLMGFTVKEPRDTPLRRPKVVGTESQSDVAKRFLDSQPGGGGELVPVAPKKRAKKMGAMDPSSTKGTPAEEVGC